MEEGKDVALLVLREKGRAEGQRGGQGETLHLFLIQAINLDLT